MAPALVEFSKYRITKGSYIKDVRKKGGRGVKQKRTPATWGEGGVKQNWTSIFGSNLIMISI